MKKMTVLLGIMVVMSGSAYAELTTAGGPDGGQRQGPPPEAYAACVGKAEGAVASLIGREGETVSGICRMADGKLVLRPDNPRGNSREGRQGPPPEAYKACENKTAGSVSQLVTPRGETLKGTCEEENGKMVLRPDANRGKQGKQ